MVKGRHGPRKKPGPKKGRRQDPHPTKLDKIDLVRDRFVNLSSSGVVGALRKEWELSKSGMGQDISVYLKACREAADIVHKNPDVLDEYHINIETGYDHYAAKMLKPVEQVIYYRANPWVVANVIIGKKNLNKATALASRFDSFAPWQKQYLRDFLDPRKHNMIFTACRSAGKTWLTALGTLIMSYLMPSVRIMIASGSDSQSRMLYKYFADMIADTYYMRLVKGKPLKTQTDTIDGGWIQAFPASHKAVHGPRPDVVIVDEACKADSDIILAAMSAAMSAQDPKFIVQSTPDSMVHIFYEWLLAAWEQQEMTEVELSQVPFFARWHLYEKTAFECDWITEDAIDALTYKYGGKNTHEYKIYVLGKPAPAEGLVFDEELLQRCMIDELPKTVTVYMEDEFGSMIEDVQEAEYSFYTTGLDAGGKHPTAIVDGCEDQIGNVYLFDNEEVRARSGDDPIINATYDHASRNWSKVQADAAPIQYFLNRKLRKKLQEDGLPGLSILPFQKLKGSMISAFRGLLEGHNDSNPMIPKLYIVKLKCEKLLKQLFTYSYSEKEFDEMPQKGDDDHVDAGLCCVWPHRRTLLSKKYKRAALKLYNLDEHMEDVDHNPFSETRPIELTNPRYNIGSD